MNRALCGVALAALACVGSAGSAIAQAWSLPIRGGWSSASLSGTDHLGSKSRNGFVASAGGELRFNEDLALEFDVAYAQKGASGTITNEIANSPSNPPQQNVYNFTGDVELDYVEFQAMVVGFFQGGDKLELCGRAGVSLGNLVTAKATGTYNGSPVDLDIKDTISSIDWAGVVGGGVRYEVKPVILTLDFIAEFGFTDINESVVVDNIRTQAFYTMLGVVIPLTGHEW